jgi:hypothetical protein
LEAHDTQLGFVVVAQFIDESRGSWLISGDEIEVKSRELLCHFIGVYVRDSAPMNNICAEE